MKKLLLIFVAIAFAISLSAQKEVPFKLIIPYGLDTVKTIGGYSKNPVSVIIDFRGADALDMTLDWGFGLDDDSTFASFDTVLFPITVNTTNCPDSICYLERSYSGARIQKLKLTRGTATPGQIFNGNYTYEK